MKRIIDLLTQVYSALLHLYPLDFRAKFADEMQSVFTDAMTDTARQGKCKLAIAFLCELRDVSGEILREHWHQRRKASMKNKTRTSPLELLTIAIPFLTYLAMTIIESLEISWVGVLIWILLGVMVILLIVSLFKGLPRWSLPTLGLLVGVLNFIWFNLWSPILESLEPPPPFLRGIFGAGIPYIGIIVLTLIIILVTALVKPLHPFFQRIREDWTLFPFALYGIMPLIMLISFDDYQGEGLYKIGMVLVLIAGLLLYVQSTSPKRKLFWLVISITLAMAIEAIGKWILVPSQNWPVWFGWHPIEQAQQIEVTSTIYTWFWTMIIVFLPALLGLLPQAKQPAQSAA